MRMDSGVTLVLAATYPGFGIGRAGSLPWRLKNEMKFFRQVTDGGVVIMGRKTWESIPLRFRPLQNRVNVIVSRNPDFELPDGVLFANSYEQALEKASTLKKKMFVIGGGQLYAAALEHPATNLILMTQIHDPDNTFKCDTFFNFPAEEWTRETEDQLRRTLRPLTINATVCKEVGVSYEYTLWSRKPSSTNEED
ncbi:Dihydrofolate reductase [Wickerhamiella sorbophila]|uniref:Dihydrofolate reductase n=1 Tax=Wickerhamiella sorbophila TaxID=45607 RepID=A0A2T0FMY0_9ASCO|nr:Dihydrofolate reductase [Wickerhamiella sorbophila]PRT56327.1 Dihydrofolate reductase [Wickerhamiella sorbophila]